MVDYYYAKNPGGARRTFDPISRKELRRSIGPPNGAYQLLLEHCNGDVRVYEDRMELAIGAGWTPAEGGTTANTTEYAYSTALPGGSLAGALAAVDARWHRMYGVAFFDVDYRPVITTRMRIGDVDKNKWEFGLADATFTGMHADASDGDAGGCVNNQATPTANASTDFMCVCQDADNSSYVDIVTLAAGGTVFHTNNDSLTYSAHIIDDTEFSVQLATNELNEVYGWINGEPIRGSITNASGGTATTPATTYDVYGIYNLDFTTEGTEDTRVGPDGGVALSPYYARCTRSANASTDYIRYFKGWQEITSQA